MVQKCSEIKDHRDQTEEEENWSLQASPVTVLFVPQTPHGALAGKLKEQEIELTKLSGEKVKIVERSGSIIKQLLIRSNP